MLISSGVTGLAGGIRLAGFRNRFNFHIGITVLSLFPAIAVLALTGSWLFAFLTSVLFNLLGLTGAHWLVVGSFHVLKPMARILGQDGLSPERMAIQMSSSYYMKKLDRGIPADRVLLLLPHCLQDHNCTFRITFDPSNCRECGGCPVGELMTMAKRLGVKVSVATGGTLARRHLKEKKPLAVVAVACPRDLGQGMLDAYPVPVIGVENSRPCGDCLDTRVDVKAVEEAITAITS